MILTSQQIIKKSDTRYKDLDNLCFLSKNLYNQALYRIRMQFFKDKSFKNYYILDKEMNHENQIDYRALPANTSQQIIKLACQNYKSFFNSYKKVKHAKIPKYLDKIKGRQVVIYSRQFLSDRFLNQNIVKLPKSNIQFKIQHNNINQVRIVPRNNYILLEVIYKVEEQKLKLDNHRYMSIDLGIDNLCTCSSNVSKSFIVNGKTIKSINQYYNKQKSKYQSILELKNHKKQSNRLYRLTLKRNNKIKDYFHKTSKYIVNQLVEQSINTLVIGKNNGWKQETKLGKKNNQNFIQIPFNMLINMLQYKCKLQGINCILQEESYTSKVSFFDNDYIPIYNKHKNNDDIYTFSGKRVKRGLYKTKNNILINADINGSLNILRKYLNVACDAIISPTSRGYICNPVKINF